MEVTKMLPEQGGAEHELIILVIRYSDASFIEDQDQWWLAGIHRDVYIRGEAMVYPMQLRLSAVTEKPKPPLPAIKNSCCGHLFLL